MEYTSLTPERRRNMLQARLGQLEADHYARTIAAAELEASGAQESDRQAQLVAQAVLDLAHARVSEELAALGGPLTPPAPLEPPAPPPYAE